MVLNHPYSICCSLQGFWRQLLISFQDCLLKRSIFLEFSWEIGFLRVYWEFIIRFVSCGIGNAFEYEGRVLFLQVTQAVTKKEGHLLSLPKHFTDGLCWCLLPPPVGEQSLDCSVIPLLSLPLKVEHSNEFPKLLLLPNPSLQGFPIDNSGNYCSVEQNLGYSDK